MIDYKTNNLPELLEFDNIDIDKFKSTELLVKEQIKLLEKKNNFPISKEKFKECKNLHYYRIPFIPIIDFNFTDIDWVRIVEEVENLNEIYIPYRPMQLHKKWSSLTLYGYSSVHLKSKNGYNEYEYLNNIDMGWTDVSKFTPELKKFIKKLPFKKLDRTRIMKIGPGGYLRPHHDGIYGCGAFNIALYNPVDCKFYLNGLGYIPFPEHTNIHDVNNDKIAKCIMPNTGYHHSVINNSKENRYHLIVHIDQKDQKCLEKLKIKNIKKLLKEWK